MSNYKSIYQIRQNNPIIRCFLGCFDIYYYTTTEKVAKENGYARLEQKNTAKS